MTFRIKTVFGGTVTIDDKNLARAYRRFPYIRTVAGTRYHRDNLLIPQAVTA